MHQLPAECAPYRNQWFGSLTQNPDAHLRLFCFPYAGGGASIFRTWAADLPSAIDVWPARLPGREGRLMEPAFTRLAALVGTLVHVLRPHLDTPYALFGHSMGALIILEIARQLRREGHPGPVLLIVSGCRAPQLPALEPPIHDLPDDAFLQRLRELNGTPAPLLEHAELMDLMLPTLRADFALCETYVHAEEPPLTCPISTFGGRNDSTVDEAQLAAWRDQTRGYFHLRMLPGDHFFIHGSGPTLRDAVADDLLRIVGE